jgi:hypothetical protein
VFPSPQDRMLVQSKKTPFQHWNVQPHHLRNPPHEVRPRSLTPHRRCPCYGGKLIKARVGSVTRTGNHPELDTGLLYRTVTTAINPNTVASA